jgi:biopolymer transport protein ExbB
MDTTITGADIAEVLTDVPVLVRLHTGNFDFTRAKEDGTDIRFLAADDKTPLKYHIERFDSLEEMALVWVRVPRIAGASKEDFIRLYWGNKEARDARDPQGTYDVSQALVYHLGETEGAAKDQTANRNHASEFVGGRMPAIIGGGVSLNGAGDHIVVPRTPTLAFQNGLTFSAWIRMGGPQTDAYLLHAEEAERSLVIGIDGYAPYCRIMTAAGEGFTTDALAQIPGEGWHHLAVTIVPQKRIAIYVDGAEVASKEGPVAIPELSGNLVVGSSLQGDHGYAGELDELQIANAPRPPAWIKAAFRSQGPEAGLAMYGDDELGRAAGDLASYFLKTVDYLRIVAKNTTLDGWLIIGILVVLGAVGFVVFMTKTFLLSAAARSNEAFLEEFEERQELASLGGKAEAFQNAPVYRIYEAGYRELQSWLRESGNPHPVDRLTPKALDAIRSTLDKAALRESRRLNAWLVVLTTGISGGPFLGLLGTVWGVMNTFAAMVEAGEGSILAMAPGVSSALATTVFGLLVAIPSLFAYNFLLGKIKDLTADINIFVDEFHLKVDRMHGGE